MIQSSGASRRRVPQARVLAAVLLVSAMGGAAAPARASADGPVSVTWGPQRFMGVFDDGTLSCPSEVFCAFSSSLTRVAREPLKPGRRWRTLRFRGRTKGGFLPGQFVDTIVCPSQRLCLGMSGTDDFLKGDAVFATRRPTSGIESYRRVTAPRDLLYPTCAGPRFCAAIGDRKTMFSRRPATKGSWVLRGRALNANYTDFFSCSRGEACIAGEGGVKTIATITQPLRPGATWRRVRPTALADGESPSAGTCADARSCVFGTSGGALYSAADVTSATGADWRRQDPLPRAKHRQVSDVECPTEDLCMAIGTTSNDGKRWQSYMLSAMTPFDAWTLERVPLSAEYEPVQSLTCPSEQLCMMYATKTGEPGRAWRTFLLQARLARTQAPTFASSF